ncbi:MAG: prepilin-type N-terminal cleavage/methylation domain-containing protein [Pyrinomonadaceae bacterium]
MNKKSNGNLTARQEKGFSVPELMIVLIVAAIILVLALPQIITSRRLFMFASAQREITTYVREARQRAMSERKPITFRYDNSSKRITVFGGSLGVLGGGNNHILELSGMGLSPADIVYGRPSGASVAALGDGTNITTLTGNAIEITFQGDGAVLDGSDNPVDNAIFFYHALYPADTAFGVSVLGSNGRVKVWKYSGGVNAYVE